MRQVATTEYNPSRRIEQNLVASPFAAQTAHFPTLILFGAMSVQPRARAGPRWGVLAQAQVPSDK